MLTIRILAVGEIKESYFSEAIAHYQKRLAPYCKVVVLELVPEEMRAETPDMISRALKKEGERLMRKMESGFNIALCIEGRQVSSEEIAGIIGEIPHTYGKSKINFIIGSSHGLCREVKEKCDMRLSFGKITIAHKLARVVLFEQIYRAVSIMNHTKYHK